MPSTNSHLRDPKTTSVNNADHISTILDFWAIRWFPFLLATFDNIWGMIILCKMLSTSNVSHQVTVCLSISCAESIVNIDLHKTICLVGFLDLDLNHPKLRNNTPSFTFLFLQHEEITCTSHQEFSTSARMYAAMLYNCRSLWDLLGPSWRIHLIPTQPRTWGYFSYILPSSKIAPC